MGTLASCKSQTNLSNRIYWSASIPSLKQPHKDNFVSLFMKKSGGDCMLSPLITAVMPNLSMVLSKDTQYDTRSVRLPCQSD